MTNLLLDNLYRLLYDTLYNALYDVGIMINDVDPDFVVVGDAFGRAPFTASFKATPQGAKGTCLYKWDFGDGTTSNEQNPVHTYARDFAHYVVTLEVQGPDGSARCCKVWEVCVRDRAHPSNTPYD